MLPATGHVTVIAKPSATAASTAFPPAFMISAAAALASGLLLTAIACAANVASAPAGKCQPCGNVAATRAGIAGSVLSEPDALPAVVPREQAATATVPTAATTEQRRRRFIG